MVFIMNKRTFFLILLAFSLLSTSCVHRAPSAAELRAEKRLQDSLDMVAQMRSVAYTDSMLQTLLPVADSLMKDFRYIRNEQYEDHGHYIYKTQLSEQNSSRCYLQASLSDDYRILVRSFYFGDRATNATILSLTADDNELRQSGSLHAFQSEGWHEILSFEDDAAENILRFISGFASSRIRVQIIKETDAGARPMATYYIDSRDRDALISTCHLGIVMQDIHQLELQQRQASLQVEKYQKRLQK